MQIGFDATPLIHFVGGIANYSKHLLQALLGLKSGDQFVAYIPSGFSSRVPWPAESFENRLKWVEVNSLNFKSRGEKDRLDLYHGTNFKLQTTGRYGGVVTIHDLWLDRHPEYSKKLFGQRLSYFRTKRRVQKASRVIAVSAFTAEEIGKFYAIGKEKISVIHHGISPEFFPDQNREEFVRLREALGLPPKPYLLFVGGANPRKNHNILFQAIASHPALLQQYSLVLVGNPNFKNITLKTSIQEFGLEGVVIGVEEVPVQSLRVLYSHASLFIFPSLYEGFGFPVLEAMACGAPVITSKYSALPEIAGDAAILVDPTNARELGAAIKKVLSDSTLQKDLKEKSRKQIANFDWKRTAEQTLEVYHQIGQRG